MSTSTLGTFVGLLKKSQLLAAEQVEQVTSELRTRFPEAKQLARELIRRGWVTAYQVNQISQGKANDLTLGSYVLLERLGEGGMGQVFKARHKSMGRVVALKLLKKERLANPDAIKRFHREIQAAARLSHPNIVMAYDADHVGNSHFFVMEYVDGTDLSALVKKKGPLSVPRAFNYMVQAAHGLQHAHDQGMVHRDIKPHNLLMTRDGQTVKILDMGLARLGEMDQDSAFTQLTQDGKVVGTPDYIAPEQARNSHTADIRSDIYSLGCTLYFLLSARVPFPGGGSIMEKLMKHQTEEPIPIQLVVPGLTDDVAEIVHKMIRRNPDERFQTPAEVGKALEPHAGGGLDGDLFPGSSPRLQLGELGSLTTAGAPSSTPRLKPSGPTSLAPASMSPPSSRTKVWPILAALAGVFLIGTVIAGVVAVVLLGRNPSKVSSNKDQEPPRPEKDKEGLPSRDKVAPKGKSPPDEKKTHFDDLAEVPIPALKRPLGPLPGLVGVLGEPRGRHWGGTALSRVMFSRDGRLLATTSGFDNAIYLWSPETLQEHGRLTVPGGASNFTFGGDATWVAVTSMDGTVRVFDVTDPGFGKQITQYQVPGLGMVNFSSDGRLTVAAIIDREARTTRTVKVWDTRTGNLRRSHTFNEGFITSAVFSPVGPRLAVGVMSTADGRARASIKLYDIEADKLLHNIDMGMGFAIPMFTPDGKQLLVMSNGSVRTYDVASGEMKHEAQVPFTSSPTLSPDGKLLAFLTRSRENKTVVHFYDVVAAKAAPYSTDVDPTVFFTQFTPDSKTVMAFGYKQPLVFIDASNGKGLPALKGWNGGAAGVAMSPNGRRLVVATSEPALRLWDFPSREEILPATGRAGPVSFMAIVGNRAIWAGSTEFDGARMVNVLRRWELPRLEPMVYRDASTAASMWTYDRHHNVLAYPQQVPEGGNTVIAIKLIHGATGRDVATLAPLPNMTWVSALAFTPDGKSLACATWMRKDNLGKSAIIFRDASTGAEQFQIPERPEQLMGLFFSRNGKMLASLGRDHNLKLFDVASHAEKPLPPTPGQTSQVTCVAWGHENRLVATGGYPQTEQLPFRLWEAGTGKVVHRFPGKAMATAVAFRPDGSAFAGADNEGNVTVWNLANDKPIRQWHLMGPALSLRFSHDGRYLITGNANGTVYVFHLDDAAPQS